MIEKLEREKQKNVGNINLLGDAKKTQDLDSFSFSFLHYSLYTITKLFKV